MIFLEGHIKLHRQFIEWEWYQNINVKVVFLHMLFKANWKDGKYQGVVVQRGSFVSSYSKLAEETGLTMNEVRTVIKNLKKTGEITVSSHAKFSVFIIENYSKYQEFPSQLPDNFIGSSQAAHRQLTGNPQAINKQLTTIEEKKEKKKDIKDIVAASEAATPPIFVSEVDGTSTSRPKTIEYPYKIVIDYLNIKAGTAYQDKSRDSRKHIKARFDEGYSVDDFKKVIDIKVDEWASDSGMAKYLRPSTLFGAKFEGYLNQKPGKPAKPKSKNDFHNFEQRNTDYDAMVLSRIQERLKE